MKPNCDHWQDCGIAGGGCCALNLFGSQPSFGVCDRCRHNRDPHRIVAATAHPASSRAQTPEEVAAAMRQRHAATRAMWSDLHLRAAASPAAINTFEELVWLTRWAGRLPCGQCRTHWYGLWDANPADLTSAAAYFAWTVKVHNLVNAYLGKPLMTVDDARPLYTSAPSPSPA